MRPILLLILWSVAGGADEIFGNDGTNHRLPHHPEQGRLTGKQPSPYLIHQNSTTEQFRRKNFFSRNRVPPYAVLMEPVIQYSQPDPLFKQERTIVNGSQISGSTVIDRKEFQIDKEMKSEKKEVNNDRNRISSKSGPGLFYEDNDNEPTHEVSAYGSYFEAPYQPEQEPIIEIIIKESNQTLPPSPPVYKAPTKKKKEPVQVFYVKYKKDPSATYGEDKVIYEAPVPAVTPPTNNESNDDVEGEISENREEITYPPPPSTTLKAIIRPDSEIYHGSGLHITFGESRTVENNRYQHSGHEEQQSAPHASVALPEKSMPFLSPRISSESPITKRHQGSFDSQKSIPSAESRDSYRPPLPPVTYQQTPQFPAQPFKFTHPKINNHNSMQQKASSQYQYSTLPQHLKNQNSQPGNSFSPQKHNFVSHPMIQPVQQSLPHQPQPQPQNQPYPHPPPPTPHHHHHHHYHQHQLQPQPHQGHYSNFQRPTEHHGSHPYQTIKQSEQLNQLNQLNNRYSTINQSPPNKPVAHSFISTDKPFRESISESSVGRLHTAVSDQQQQVEQVNRLQQQQQRLQAQITRQKENFSPPQKHHASFSTEIIKSISPEEAGYSNHQFQPPLKNPPDFRPQPGNFGKDRFRYNGQNENSTKIKSTNPSYTNPNSTLAESESSGGKKAEEDKKRKEETKNKNVAALPEEVPDDLREQLLSSGILSNADIQILDYDKVGDIPLENLPPEALANFQAVAGSEPVTVVSPYKSEEDSFPSYSEKKNVIVKPGSGKKIDKMEMKVVRFNSESNIANKYVKEGATQLEPVVLNDSKYNRYLPLKISGTQFPVPDVPQLIGRNVTSVVILAPVDYEFLQRRDKQAEEARVGRRSASPVLEVQGVHFVAGDVLKDLVKTPNKENYKKWLDKENETALDKQSVVLLIVEPAKRSHGGGKEIFMYDIATKRVSKLKGELSSTFVQVAESNSKNRDLEEISDSPSAPGGDFTIKETSEIPPLA